MTWSSYYSLQFLRIFFALLALGLLLYALYANHRDRPSLLWPKATGTVTQCSEVSHSRGHSSVDITYIYEVNGQRYSGNTIALWSPDFRDGRPVETFVAAHPARSTVDVYYELEHPENAVLIPGPDENRNRVSLWGGSIALVLGIIWAYHLRGTVAEVKASVLAAEAEKNRQD
jgi:hypothetical protein